MKKDDKQERPEIIDKLLSAIKNWKQLTIKKKPETPDFKRYSNWKQTEEEYQKEQEEWMKKFKKK